MIGSAGATMVWSRAASIMAIITPTMIRRFCPSVNLLACDISIERTKPSWRSRGKLIPATHGSPANIAGTGLIEKWRSGARRVEPMREPSASRKTERPDRALNFALRGQSLRRLRLDQPHNIADETVDGEILGRIDRGRPLAL